jgi:hypothetical protein
MVSSVKLSSIEPSAHSPMDNDFTEVKLYIVRSPTPVACHLIRAYPNTRLIELHRLFEFFPVAPDAGVGVGGVDPSSPVFVRTASLADRLN